MMERDFPSWPPTPYIRRAQRLFVDLLGGGEEWGCRSMPQVIRGGVRADRSPTYIFAAREITPEHRAALAWFAGDESIDVIGVGHGPGPADPVRIFLALRRQGKTLELACYRLLWLNGATDPQLLPQADGPTVVFKRGDLILIDSPTWPRDDERARGLAEGARLVQEIIWSD